MRPSNDGSVPAVGDRHIGARARAVWQSVRSRLGSHPRLVPVLPLGGDTYRWQVVGPGTGVCIEGFPRSANTFVVRSFREWNPEAVVARHMHVGGQIDRARKLGIPCAVLIREPAGAISSHLRYFDAMISPERAIRDYVRFYRRALANRDAIVVCDFDEVTVDPGVVVERLNERFETGFHHAPTDPETRAERLDGIRKDQEARGERSERFSAPRADGDRDALQAAVVAAGGYAEAEAIYRELSPLRGQASAAP